MSARPSGPTRLASSLSGSSSARFLIALATNAGARGVLGLLLLMVVGLTEGVSLALLVPLLQLAGLGSGSVEVSVVADVIAQAFRAVGVPLTLPALLVAYAAIVITRAAIVRSRDVILADIRFGFVEALRARLYEAVARADWLFLARSRSADFNHILATEAVRVGQVANASLAILVNGVVAAMYIAFALSLSARITVLALASGASLALILSFYARQARRLGVELTGSNRKMFATISEFLGGLKMVKSYGAESHQTEAFSEQIGTIRKRQLAFIRVDSGVRLTNETAAVITLCFLVYLAAAASVSATVLLLMVLIFARLLPLFGRLVQNLLEFQHLLPAFDAIVGTTARCEAAAEAREAQHAPKMVLNHMISLQGVRFRYRKDRREQVLQDLDLPIPAGQTTAIIGPSGAGKSTIADLLMGLLTPDEGSVLIDGRPLEGERIHSWRRAVAYVPQDAFLFNETVRANLLWPDSRCSEAELWEALAHSAADDFVLGLPEGLDTKVGERGQQLSGGERQRLALARALLRKPALLILDEATSAVDAENEQRLQQAIGQLHGDLTVVIIAHRLSTLRFCDQVVVVKKGRVIESGTPATLKANEGALFRLHLEESLEHRGSR